MCRDAHTGFGLLVNWNLLPDGALTIRFYDQGVEFANTTFTVTRQNTTSSLRLDLADCVPSPYRHGPWDMVV